MAYYITCAILGLGLWVIYVNTKRKQQPLPPGPKGYPLVGNALQLDGKRPWHTLMEFKETYGEIVHLRLFNQNIVVLNTAKVAGDLLDRRAAIYSDRPRAPVVDYITGGLDVIFLNLGPLWRSMRRAAHEALNMRAISRYQSIQMREGIRFAEDMLQTPEKHPEHTQQYADSHGIFSSFAAFEITSILYNNSSLGQQVEELSKFIHILEHSLSLGTYLVNHLAVLEYVPEFLAKWKRDSRKVYEAYSKEFLNYFLPIKESVLQKNESGPSFCATLVETQERHGLSDLESAWLSATLYVAGYDTTATTLGWLILAMVAYPDVQRKAQEELDRVVGRARVPTLDDMEYLPYLRAIIKEVLRWRPPSPLGVFHTPQEDDVYGGYFIPKGTAVITNLLAMNHDVTIYGPDVDQFRPERFLNEEGTHKPSPPDSKDEGHYSFGFGRRICAGRHLANNALYTFGITLWAMHLESGEAGGTIDTNDIGTGLMSNAPRFTLLTKPRFSEALDLLKLAKDEW